MESLEKLALTKIAAYLWNVNALPDIQQGGHWFQTEKEIAQKVKIARGREMSIIVADKLNNLVRIVGNEILKFMFYLEFSIGIENKNSKLIVSQSCWKKGAILDSQQTIYKAIHTVDLSGIMKFKLASHYCIKSCVQESWNKLSDEEKSIYLKPTGRKLTVENVWAFMLGNQQNRFGDTISFYPHQCINEYIINELVDCLNVDAIKFFFKKLSNERKKIVLRSVLQSLDERFPNQSQWYKLISLYSGFQTNLNSLLVYLFSDVGIESLDSVINNDIFSTFRILECYLDWPYQKNFLEAAKTLKDYMQDIDYSMINAVIWEKIELEFDDFNYLSLLDQNNMFSRSVLI